jgi:hypothetical protein
VPPALAAPERTATFVILAGRTLGIPGTKRHDQALDLAGRHRWRIALMGAGETADGVNSLADGEMVFIGSADAGPVSPNSVLRLGR